MPVQFKDYYETLGVPRTATSDEIKKAFRKLARIHHPDVAKNKSTAEAKFKEINEAYEVLGDPEKRKKYDTLGANWEHGGDFTPPPNYGGARYGGGTAQGGPSPFGEFSGTGFSDFFEQFFGGGGVGGRGGFQRGSPYQEEQDYPVRGSDAEADLLVTLDEVLNGSKREVTLRRTDQYGKAFKTDTYQVKIPAGVREGQKIRLAGQGTPGHGGGPAGDLYLRVRLAKHPDFTVEGFNLRYEVPLAPWEAVLGKKVSITTLDGSANLTIKPGTQAGTQLRLRGLGLPLGAGKRGDLFAVVTIEVPETVTDSEKLLWEQLAAKSSFDPRG
jgi:curved DNA-binding protein